MPSDRTVGVRYAIAAHTMWGLFPLFFGLLRHINAIDILAQRAFWAGTLSIGLVAIWRRAELSAWWARPDRGRQIAMLALTAALLASNWAAYIYAVTRGHVLEASIGYFICPLVTVALGVLVLGERLSVAQKVALGLAAAGVLELALRSPRVPWLALYLAVSFSVYGLLRKRLVLDPLLASSLEALLMMPIALVYFAATPAFEVTSGVRALLVLSGAITAVPLILFAMAAKRLPYSIMGLVQYVTPTLQALLAVVIFGEAIGATEIFAFALIWSGIAVSIFGPRVRFGLTLRRA